MLIIYFPPGTTDEEKHDATAEWARKLRAHSWAFRFDEDVGFVWF